MRNVVSAVTRVVLAVGLWTTTGAWAQNVPTERQTSAPTHGAPQVAPPSAAGAAHGAESVGSPSRASTGAVTETPQDVPYPGVISLSVDATDLAHHIFHARERIPVAGPGPLTLLYPQWLPGHHSPTGPLEMFAGLTIEAGGKRIHWRRDPVNVFAFHVEVPQGVSALDLSFQFLSPVERKEGRVVMTPEMLNLEWNTVVLYPAGHFSRRITFAPSVKLPEGWKLGTALEVASRSGSVVQFKHVTLNNLVDSPIFAGRYFQRVDLDPGGTAPVHLNVVADRPDLLEITPEQLAVHRALVQQAYRLYGAHHYDHYDFLLSLSDRMSGIGLEHHQSSEDGVGRKYFTDWDHTTGERDLLPHEYTHSWDGKFRRPADLWTPEFSTPMQDSLLWVYEGQTQYWGYVLSARSGLWSQQQALDAIALTAATYDHHIGRQWRPLEDTTNDPIIADRRPIPWRNWQLAEDYYSEGQLMWLDADTLIRKLSNNQRSLDDFARAFYGVNNGSYVTLTYTFDDVVRALQSVQPYDWAAFLNAHVHDYAKGAPLDGLARGGYQLVYNDEETPYEKSVESLRKAASFTFSLGFTVDEDNTLADVQYGSPAFKAGLTVGTKLVALNGEHYANDDLKAAIRWAEKDKAPLQLLVEENKHYRTVSIDYHGGLRYPHLEPTPGGPRSLDQILAPKH